jgi:hypothetical protein
MTIVILLIVYHNEYILSNLINFQKTWRSIVSFQGDSTSNVAARASVWPIYFQFPSQKLLQMKSPHLPKIFLSGFWKGVVICWNDSKFETPTLASDWTGHFGIFLQNFCMSSQQSLPEIFLMVLLVFGTNWNTRTLPRPMIGWDMIYFSGTTAYQLIRLARNVYGGLFEMLLLENRF